MQLALQVVGGGGIQVPYKSRGGQVPCTSQAGRSPGTPPSPTGAGEQKEDPFRQPQGGILVLRRTNPPPLIPTLMHPRISPPHTFPYPPAAARPPPAPPPGPAGSGGARTCHHHRLARLRLSPWQQDVPVVNVERGALRFCLLLLYNTSFSSASFDGRGEPHMHLGFIPSPLCPCPVSPASGTPSGRR